MEKEQANRIENKLESVLDALQENNTNQTRVLDRIASHQEDTKRLHTRLDGIDQDIVRFKVFHASEESTHFNFETRLKKLEDTQNKTVWLFITSVVGLGIAAIIAIFSYFTTHGSK